jgi:acylphosphatase
MEEVRAHLYVRGRVQGVSFRYYTRQQAFIKGVSGWVRNLWDGRVEVVIQGDEASVMGVIAWCKHGPSSARVDDVWMEWETPQEDCVGFVIRPTARGGQDGKSTED